MKKLFVIFLSLCYLVLSSGFTQYHHTCNGMGIKLLSLTNTEHKNSDKPCPICSNNNKDLTKKKKGCCQHEAKVVKVDDTVKKQSNLDLSIKFWGNTIPNKMLGSVFDFSVETETKKLTTYLTAKIPIRGNPLYILHCVYRI